MAAKLSEARVWAHLFSEARPSEGILFFPLGRWGQLPVPPGSWQSRLPAGCAPSPPCPALGPLPAAGTGAGGLPLPPPPLGRPAAPASSCPAWHRPALENPAPAAQRPAGASGRTSTWRRAGSESERELGTVCSQAGRDLRGAPAHRGSAPGRPSKQLPCRAAPLSKCEVTVAAWGYRERFACKVVPSFECFVLFLLGDIWKWLTLIRL